MITLNDIKHKLISFFDNHAQIANAVYEDDFDFNAESNLAFPIAQIENIGSTVEGKVMNRSYNVVLADKINDNVVGMEDDIYSDLELIAEDFITFLQYEASWSFNQRTALRKITDDTGDRIAGYAFQISLSSVRPQNECAIPTLT